ncbi:MULTISPECIES: hypothetical protein [unclassified Streptomyces]|uniref:hypothetical protein n=1 Tax=unclassified Streptomyces TaxID=2593676 RepID=UPI00344D9A05
MTTASLPRKSSRPEPGTQDTTPPQHHGLFLEPHFAPGLLPLDDEEDLDAAYEALPAPTTSAREPERTTRRPRRR